MNARRKGRGKIPGVSSIIHVYEVEVPGIAMEKNQKASSLDWQASDQVTSQ